MKKASAIIVNWNDKEVTTDCIRSLQKQDYQNLEIIVSDNGSTDGSVEHLKKFFPDIRLIENGKNLGFGSAVNRGFKAATGDVLLFLNNDLVLKPDSIRELAWLLESEQHIGATVPKILYTDIPDKINSFGVLIHFTGIACPNKIDQKDSQDLSVLETACGGIFMFKREVFESVGGFDENLFLYHEDHDLSWRIRLAGWKILVNPKAVIHHHYQFKKGARKYYSSEKNRLYLLLKNMEWKTLLLVSPALLLVEISQWVHALFNGWFFLKIKSYFEITALLPNILKQRKSSQSIRKVSDKEITRLYEGSLAVGGINNPLLDKVLSPSLNFYWKLIKGLI